MARNRTGREDVGVETSEGRPTGTGWEEGLEPVLVRPAGRRPLSLRETLNREPGPRRRPSTPTMRFLCAAVWLLSGFGTATAAWSVRQTMFPPTGDPTPASVWQNASTDGADRSDDDGTVASPETRPIAVRPEDRYDHDEAEVGDDSSGRSDDHGVADDSGTSASSGPGPGPTTMPATDDSSGPGSGEVRPEGDSSGPGSGDDEEDDSGSSGSGRGGSGTDGSGTGAATDNSGSGSASSGSGSGSGGSGSDSDSDSDSDSEAP
jgi:hypothetical protein